MKNKFKYSITFLLGFVFCAWLLLFVKGINITTSKKILGSYEFIQDICMQSLHIDYRVINDGLRSN